MRNSRFNFFLVAFIVSISFFNLAKSASADVTLSASQCGNECAALLNSSLANNNVITLGAGTYNIDSTLHLKSGNTLTGERGAVIRLINHASWDRYVPMLTAPDGCSNIKIYGFEIDGNKANNQDYDANYAKNDNTKSDHNRYYGHEYYDMIKMTSCNNVEIHDMYLHHNLDDIVLYPHGTNLKFYNNTVRQQGHATVYVFKGSDIWMYNNNVDVFCNAGMRSDGSTRFYVYNNTFSQSGGQAAVELQGFGEIWICTNTYNSCTQLDRQSGGSNPFTGIVHTSGCPNAGASAAPPAVSASVDNGASGANTGDSGGGPGGGEGGGTTPPNCPAGSTLSFKKSSYKRGDAMELDGKQTGDYQLCIYSPRNGGERAGIGSMNKGVFTLEMNDGSPLGTWTGTMGPDCGPYLSSSNTPACRVTVALDYDTPIQGSSTDVNPATGDPDTPVPALFPIPDAPASATTKCRTEEGSAALIPCGRNADDPKTPWDECSPCTLFAMILMGQLVLEFLLKLAAIAATLSIIFGGFLYISAAGKPDIINKAKSIIQYTLTGFAIIFISWIIVDSILSSLGYINPLGGKWYSISNTATDNTNTKTTN